jgi:hypothetical protein
VIPYLCVFDANDLAVASYSPAELSIGQHGYCHVSRRWAEKQEFDLYEPLMAELHDLSKGKQALEQRFGTYFDRGISLPFDAMPVWLGSAWEQMGGLFVSAIRNLPQSGRVKVVTAAVDVWNWAQNGRHSWSKLRRDLARSFSKLGYAGLVLHPQHLHTSADLQWLEEFLSLLNSSGVISVPMATVAGFQATSALSSSSRRYSALDKTAPRVAS